MKTSLVVTVLNEERTITEFLKSVREQSLLPNEVIIVDGGSTDTTKLRIKNYESRIMNQEIHFKLLTKKGNRSIGRNEGTEKASGEIILYTDAGCILDKNWVREIIKPFLNPSTDVVAGYYKGVSKTVFQKCLVPYVLVMPAKLNMKTFLPATRSMAIRKSVWEKIGGFNEKLSHNEDYVFARELKKQGAKIVFQKNAIVYWIPRENPEQAFTMFFRFAYGDAESAIVRPKVALVFIRYIIFVFLLTIAVFLRSKFILTTSYLLLATYIVWSVIKNYKYVNHWQAFFWLPILQILSDIAIIAGTTLAWAR